MRNYFLRRVLLIPPTLFGITLIVFVITRFVPGGPLERAIMEAQQMNASGRGGSVSGQGQALSESQIQQLKEYYGFDKPWYQSYVQWVGKLLRGDLGSSYRYNEPVWDIMKSHFPVSLFFGIATIVATYVVCIPLGVVKAIRHRTVMDNLTSVVIFMGYAVPGYVLGTLLLLLFAARLEWFPMSGFTSMDHTFMSAVGEGRGPRQARGAAADLLPGRQLRRHHAADEEPPDGQPGRRLHPHRGGQGRLVPAARWSATRCATR